ncbi:hypothetical protein EV702DRAFT_1267212 [Suillus placidus]|uniref:Uncharacterized protein n=1 Tax=Suillus placidus TaxID=48579 RepID=A0A9P7A053_9AGAM|nr:hypothetical protein EV702DRAFT_1267212 [Suillus placidus]
MVTVLSSITLCETPWGWLRKNVGYGSSTWVVLYAKMHNSPVWSHLAYSLQVLAAQLTSIRMAGAHNRSDLRQTLGSFVDSLRCIPGDHEGVSSESHLQALRLIVHFGQLFSAFLLAQQSNLMEDRLRSSYRCTIKDIASVRSMLATGHSRYAAFCRAEVAKFSLYLWLDTYPVVLLSCVGSQKDNSGSIEPGQPTDFKDT